MQLFAKKANKLGREFVIQVTGTVRERSSKNAHIPTGDIELIVSELNVLNTALTLRSRSRRRQMAVMTCV